MAAFCIFIISEIFIAGLNPVYNVPMLGIH